MLADPQCFLSATREERILNTYRHRMRGRDTLTNFAKLLTSSIRRRPSTCPNLTIILRVLDSVADIINIIRVLKHLQDSERFPANLSSFTRFGFRVAIATLSIAIINYMEDTQVFFTTQRLFWAQIMTSIGRSLFSVTQEMC